MSLKNNLLSIIILFSFFSLFLHDTRAGSYYFNVWNVTINDIRSAEATGVAVDKNSNIIVAGYGTFPTGYNYWNITKFDKNGIISWNCRACDNASQCSFAAANWTVNVSADTTPPTYSSNASQLITTYTTTGYSNFSVTWSDASSNTVT